MTLLKKLMKFILFIKNYQAFILATVFALIFISEHLVPQKKIHQVLKHDLINFFFGAINVTISFSAGFYFSKYLNWAETKKFGLLFQLPINPIFKLVIIIIIAGILSAFPKSGQPHLFSTARPCM